MRVFDHDFPSFADGYVIPHGLYDLKGNRGYINLCGSHDTSEFACDSIWQWWLAEGRTAYPSADSLLLLCDGGGSNSASQLIFKQDLHALVNRIGLEIRVAHYPPYTSKYNPIEHRMFCHVSRSLQAVVLKTPEVARQFIARTTTALGLRVIADRMEMDRATTLGTFWNAYGTARLTAHTAFADPSSLPGAPARRSIELRTLVFWDEPRDGAPPASSLAH